MLFQNNRLQELEISKELYTRLDRFLSKDFSKRYTKGDSDKDLEIALCKVIAGDSRQVDCPRDLIEEFNEVDCWVDGESVQIKCRNSSDFLVLEDYKLKKDGTKTSWVDRSIAQYTIFIYTSFAPVIKYSIFETQDLKRALNNLRYWRDNHQLENEIEELWMNKFFNDWKWEHSYKINNQGTNNECAFYKIIQN